MLFAVLLGACAWDVAPPPSCKLLSMPCSDLGASPLCLDLPGCRMNYTCQGTASCTTARNATTSACDNRATGCSWSASGCAGTPLPCSNSLYARDTSDCENVGCTWSELCGGGNVVYDCSLQTSESSCNAYVFCRWK